MFDMNDISIRFLTKGQAGFEREDSLSQAERHEASQYGSQARKSEYIRSRNLFKAELGQNHSFHKIASGLINWPQGIVASLSHKDGQIAIAHGLQRNFSGIGVDLELVRKVGLHLMEKVCTENEIAQFFPEGIDADPRKLATIFSLKEAIYKAIYPLGRIQFWFHDAEVCAWDETSGSATLKLLMDTSHQTPRGSTINAKVFHHSLEGEAFVLTVAALPSKS